MAGKYMRGALVELKAATIVPLPNVIVFQFNPETLTHQWSPLNPTDATGADPLAVQGIPGESFTFTLAMDANDMIADGSVLTAGIAQTTGIYARLAALELLLYPIPADSGGLLGTVSASIGASGVSLSASAGGSGSKSAVPKGQVPMVLFVWGPGRILPVRVTALSITEKLYDALLNPTHAEAQISLKVLTTDDLKAVTGTLGTIANAAYNYSQKLREALAVANLANSVESIIGMLPV